MGFFDPILTADYISRPNRFTVTCRLNGLRVNAYLPNPGRLWELFFPGARLYLEKADSGRKLPYTVVAVEREDRPVMLHTHKTNIIARHLIEGGRVPGLVGAEIVKSEVTIGRSRFDFQLKQEEIDIYLEVKSCTLFGGGVAMFPDAVTARGKRHVEELARLAEAGAKCVVLFIVGSLEPDYFMPEYHTDLAFSQALLAAKSQVNVIALGVGWNPDLTLKEEVKTLKIPWDVVEHEARDRGSYLLILRLTDAKSVEVGSLGVLEFRPGYYIYVGSAMKNLAKRIERHKRLRKKMHWHIDYLRRVCDFHAALPIRSSERIECLLAEAVKEVSEFEITDFGSSDCACRSHLFYMPQDPLNSRLFHRMLQSFRMQKPIPCVIG
ncbi:sugar fermentation stimulation protein A [archaeon BMS3Bbin16]|nr:sugar fermentation stimulation protein A [archaeon BMS3Bbin16]